MGLYTRQKQDRYPESSSNAYISISEQVSSDMPKIAKSLVQNQGVDLDSDFIHYDTSVESKLVEEAEAADLAFVFSQLFGKGLKDGWFSGHPYEVVPNGLTGVEEGLRNLKQSIAH
jgi:hypothetical protein